MKTSKIIFGLLLLSITIGFFLLYNFNKNKTEEKYLGNAGFTRKSFAYNGHLKRTYHFPDQDYSIFHISKNGDIYVKDFLPRSYEIFYTPS